MSPPVDSVLGLVVKVRQEERLLIEHFGDAYRTYQRDVPALIPGFSAGSQE